MLNSSSDIFGIPKLNMPIIARKSLRHVYISLFLNRSSLNINVIRYIMPIRMLNCAEYSQLHLNPISTTATGYNNVFRLEARKSSEK